MSYEFRRDNRTDEEFAEDIKHTTRKERFLVELFKKEMEGRGHTVEIEDNGVDNTGEIVMEGSTAADFILTINTLEYKTEVKNSPSDRKCTFKVHNMQKYAANDTYILLFHSTGNINRDTSKFKKKEARWAWITPEKIGDMLEDKKNDFYKDKYFGYKEVLQITPREYSKYFDSREFKHI